MKNTSLQIPVGNVSLSGDLVLPPNLIGLVVFAHGSGSSRLSSRNQMVARYLERCGLGTFLFDLLTPEEDRDYSNRFDIPLITQRLVQVTGWLKQQPQTGQLTIGYFGASTGAAAALGAAAQLGEQIRAVVSRGGRPDLTLPDLHKVQAATLLIVGSLDAPVIPLNENAYSHLNSIKQLAIVDGATHLFEEPGALEEVSDLAAEWFLKWL